LLREYLLSVFAAAILCCMAMSITGKKGLVGSVVQIITALIMTAVLIKPLRNLQLPNLSQFSWQSIGQEAADAGAESAQREILEAIEEKTVLCIQNKASQYGASLDVRVELDQMFPKRVVLVGAISPYAKNTLSRWLNEDLGIAPEDQEWIY